MDQATTAEHLYVGLTRGRQHNLACVVCEPLEDDHRRLLAPNAADVLRTALGRSGAELSATETSRAALIRRPDDRASLRAALAEALRRVDALAGKDRSREIALCQRMGANQTGISEGAGGAEQLSTLVAAQQARSEWIEAHPEVVAYVLDLRRRIKQSERGAYGAVRGADQGTMTQSHCLDL